MLTLKDFIAATASATPDARLIVRVQNESGTVDLMLDLTNYTPCIRDFYPADTKLPPVLNGLIEFFPDNTKAVGEPTS